MNDILDQIDHAVRDYEVGKDAMRWTPDAPARPAAPTPANMILRDTYIVWHDAGVDAPQLFTDLATLNAALTELGHRIPAAAIATEQFTRTINQAPEDT